MYIGGSVILFLLMIAIIVGVFNPTAYGRGVALPALSGVAQTIVTIVIVVFFCAIIWALLGHGNVHIRL